MRGSIAPRCLPIGIATLIVGSGLAIIRKLDFTEKIFSDADYIDDPFALRLFSIVVGYLIVVRSNVALGRWMTGISEIQVMLTKWTDAFNDINGFLAGKESSPEQLERIRFFRVRVAHYFCLMSCLAFAKLRSGSNELKLVEVPIKAKYPVQIPKKKQSFAHNSPHAIDFLEKDLFGHHEMGVLDLSVLHAPTPQELELLDRSYDKVKAMCLWIAQAIMKEHRSGGVMDAPPPITTRIFSELTDGMLGYQQAVKISYVPFPFPFAQAVDLLLWMLYACIPFYVDCFTRSIWITPLVCFVLPMCYCGLNQIAVELEEPFGNDSNDVDIEDRHEAFVRWICEVLSQPLEPPVSENKELELAILEGYDKRSLKTGHVPWFVNTEEGSEVPQHSEVDEYVKSSRQELGVLDMFQSWLGISSCCAKDPNLGVHEQVVEHISETAR